MRPRSGHLCLRTRYLGGWRALAFGLLMPVFGAQVSFAQAADHPGSPNQQQVVAIENRLNQLTETLSQTEKMLDQSRAEIQLLRSQLDALRAQTTAPSP